MSTDQNVPVDPRCIKCGKRQSDHNWFGEFGYLCRNGSNTFEAEASSRLQQPIGGTAAEAEVHRLSQIYADATGYSENYVQFHRGLSSPSADKIRKGIRAVIATLRLQQPIGGTEKLWALCYLHDWDPDGHVSPQVHGVYATWQEAEGAKASKMRPEKYTVAQANRWAFIDGQDCMWTPRGWFNVLKQKVVAALTPVPIEAGEVERPWQPWERNFSGGRLGVQEQQGANENWMVLHVESGGAKTTTSLRYHEAWDLALMLSPQLKLRLDELLSEARKAKTALHSLTWRECDTVLLRQIADEHDCGDSCEYSGARCPKIDRDGCNLADADQIRAMADGIDLGNATVLADVLRAIDSCGGTHSKEDTESRYADGYNDALRAAEKEVTRLLSPALLPPTGNSRGESGK